MATTVKMFRSTDGGAPVLSGTAGALLAVLDAVLVSGYGGGTPTSITCSDATATLTYPAHGFSEGDVVSISGCDQAEYNGDVVIANVTGNTFDFTVTGSPATPATGTITFKKAPAGWTKPYANTNLAAYLMGGGSGALLRVDDSPAQFPRVCGYSAMTDVNTGSNKFPSEAQFSGGLYWVKSSAASATARPWMIVGNDRFFHVWVDFDTYQNGQYYYFGDAVSYVTGDAYNAVLTAGSSAAITSNWSSQVQNIGTTTAANYMAGSYTQVAASIAVGRNVSHMTGLAESENIGRAPTTSRVPYPNPCDGGAYLSPVWLHESNKALRGHVPGLWALASASTRPLSQGDIIDGGGAMAGRRFMAWNTCRNASGQDAQVLIEISNTWTS
jgi:hypothetical protein